LCYPYTMKIHIAGSSAVRKSKRLLIASFLALAGLAYLIATAAFDSTMYYFTVEEALAQGIAHSGRQIRLNGDIVPGTIQWEPKEMRLSFAVKGESGAMVPAVYYGPRPDNFTEDATAILEGRFDENGVFRADTLMLACPSRFEVAADEHPASIPLGL